MLEKKGSDICTLGSLYLLEKDEASGFDGSALPWSLVALD